MIFDEILKFYASVKNCENDNTDDNDTCIVQTFTAWVNSHLRKAGTQIENIEEDFRFVLYNSKFFSFALLDEKEKLATC